MSANLVQSTANTLQRLTPVSASSKTRCIGRLQLGRRGQKVGGNLRVRVKYKTYTTLAGRGSGRWGFARDE